MKRKRNRKPMPKLTQDEINSTFGSARGILQTHELAELLGLKVRTIYEWVARDYLEGTYQTRGKYHFFWRDRVIKKLFNGTEWQTPS